MKKQTKLGLVLAAAAVISVSVASLVSARGWVQQGADWYYVDNNGDYVTGTIQSSGNAKFYLDEDTGAMQRDYLLQDYNGNTYYFGSNGAMVTNTWVAVDSAIVDSGADYIPDNFWFYFQASGKAVKASSGVKKTTIDGKKYAFSEDGTMLTGWIADGKTVDADDNTNPFADAEYYAGGDNDGVLRSGWVTYYDGYDGDDSDPEADYTNLYFYFNPSNNTKTDNTTKKINGKTYAFSDEGVMLSGWDAANSGVSGLVADQAYFSGEDDGHQVKKGWIYAVPTVNIDSTAYNDDEEKYMYFNASGAIVTDTFKKINGKYYVFNGSGIMKTGLVIWNPSAPAGSKFVDTFDLDWANGSDLAKKGIIRTGSDPATDVITVNANCTDGSGNTYAIYNFADDGSRKDGSNTVTFADDDYTFVTNAAGHKPSGASAKKYYSLGIQLKASADVKYGIYTTDLASGALTAQSSAGAISGSTYETLCKAPTTTAAYYVLNTSGSKVKGKAQGYKDADGNYWLLDRTTGNLKGIWSVNVKYAEAKFTTRKMKNVNGFDSNSPKFKTTEATASEITGEFSAAVSSLTETALSGAEWTVKVSDNDANVCFVSDTIKGYWFQSDYGDKSNVWIPFEMVDNVGKTCDQGLAQTHYLVTPTDDYFLNCYWN